MLLDVSKEFDNVLTTVFTSKPDVLKFLIGHERKQVCLDNLCRELNGIRKLGKENYLAVIASAAKMFAKAALDYKETQLLSEAEKRSRIYNADIEKRVAAASQDIEKEATTTTFSSYAKIQTGENKL